LLYRKVGVAEWSYALDPSLTRVIFPLVPADGEIDYGFASAVWVPTGLNDGNYELVLHVICQSSGLSFPPPGVDEYYSQVVQGTIRRVSSHRVVTQLHPTSSELVAGQEISITFNELVNCELPYWFATRVTVNGVRTLAIGSEAIVSCQANTIFIEIGGIQSLIGSLLNVTIVSQATGALVTSWTFTVIADACPIAVFPQSFTSFIISTAVNNTLAVTAVNPRVRQAAWSRSSRLQNIALVYRKQDALAWSTANVTFITAIPAGAVDTGFADVPWIVPSTFADGAYDLALQITCSSSVNRPIPGDDGSLSSIVSGVIDLTPPLQFGPAVPAAKFLPGGAISVTFNEDVDCSLPFKFASSILFFSTTTGVAPLQLTSANLTASCDRRTIAIDISSTKASVAFANYIGGTMKVSISGVTDRAGNAFQGELSWSFILDDFTLSNSTVQISGLKLSIPFNANLTNPNSTAATTLVMSLATFLKVPQSRIANIKFTMSSDLLTLASFSILQAPVGSSRREDRRSSEQLASVLKTIHQSVQNNDVAVDSFLKQYLDPSSHIEVVIAEATDAARGSVSKNNEASIHADHLEIQADVMEVSRSVELVGLGVAALALLQIVLVGAIWLIFSSRFRKMATGASNNEQILTQVRGMILGVQMISY